MSVANPYAQDRILVSAALVRDALEILLLALAGNAAAAARSYVEDTAAGFALALFANGEGPGLDPDTAEPVTLDDMLCGAAA